MTYRIEKDKYLSPNEFNVLREKIALDWSRDALIIKLAIETGSRAQELLNITHSDLDIPNQSVYIRGLKSSDNREIPISPELFLALFNLPRNETLFNCSYSWLVRVWSKYTMEITQKSFKSLRHTFAMNLYEKSNDLLLVQAALGHRNVQNSLVYAEHFYKSKLLFKLRK